MEKGLGTGPFISAHTCTQMVRRDGTSHGQKTVDNNPQITPLAFLQQEHNIPRLVACIATFGVNFPSTWCGDTVFTPPAVTLGGGEAELGLRRHGTVE